MRKYIQVTKEVSKQIEDLFGCGSTTVYYALNMDDKRGRSDLANKIRKAALERGGVVMVETPELETIHDHDGYMRQRFANGALLELDKTNDTGAIIYRGETVQTYTDVHINDIPTMQQYAASL